MVEHHRTTKVASEAIMLAINGHQFTANHLRDHLEDEMENPPSKNTISTVLRQLREDGLLEIRGDNRTMISKEMQSWREGNFVPENKIHAEDVAKGVSKKVGDKIKQSIMEELTGDAYYTSSRSGKLKRSTTDE